MTILYAPSFREEMDLLHANCLCAYDIQVLEMIQKHKGGGIMCFISLIQKLPQNIIKSF